MRQAKQSPVPAASGPGHVSEFLDGTYLGAYQRLYGNPSSQSNSRKRLPPFGKELADAIDRGMTPRNDVKVFVGAGAMDAARMAQGSILVALALPDGSQPSEFRWPVDRCGVVVFEASPVGADLLQRLALELFKGGAHVVRIVHVSGRLSVFRQGAAE